jgi:hypothetical protein
MNTVLRRLTVRIVGTVVLPAALMAGFGAASASAGPNCPVGASLCGPISPAPPINPGGPIQPIGPTPRPVVPCCPPNPHGVTCDCLRVV